MATKHSSYEGDAMNIQDEEHAANIMEIGVDLGLYTLANILIESGGIDLDQLQTLADMSAKHIEELTGIPAEDFSLKIKPIVDTAIKAAKETS